MKAQKDLKAVNSKVMDSDELGKGRKLKPEKKEKNQKRSIYSEIEELDDPELQYKRDEDSLEDYLDDDDEFEDEEEFDDDDEFEDDEEFDDEGDDDEDEVEDNNHRKR